jgi:type II secretory pathway component PulJ
LLFFLAGWVGFAAGQVAGGLVGFTLLSVGSLNMLSASLGSFIALFAARWLASRDAEAKE